LKIEYTRSASKIRWLDYATLLIWRLSEALFEKAVVPEPEGLGGRLRFDPIIMFNTLVLQRLYHFSDTQTDFMICDRLSFTRFIGVGLHETVPMRRRSGGSGKS
jgi:transposase, IS5 family